MTDRSLALAAPRVALRDARRPAPEIWLAATIVLAGVIRFSTLGVQSFWLDEAYTHGIVAGSLGHVVSQVPATESTPPLYYVLAWGWGQLFGVHEAGLRSFSALCGTLTVPVVWAVGRRLVSERVGVVAALLVAVNPLLAWYSQEARAYALAGLLCALTLLAFLRALERPTRTRLAAWGVVGALALCAHYFSVLAVIPEAVWLGVALRSRGELTLARAACGLAPLALAAAALVPLAVHQNDGRASYVAHEGSLPYRLGTVVKEDVFAYIGPNSMAVALLAGVLVLAVARLWPDAPRTARRAIAPMLAIGLGGIAVAALSAAVTDYIDSRNLIVVLPAFVLAAAILLGTRRGWAAAVPLGLLVASGLIAIGLVQVDPHAQRSNWRGAAQALGAPGGVRAIVSIRGARATLPPYLSGLRAAPAGFRVAEVDLVVLASPEFAQAPPQVGTPALPGFRLVERRRTDTYDVLRYRAGGARPETASAVLGAFGARPAGIVLLQAPR